MPRRDDGTGHIPGHTIASLPPRERGRVLLALAAVFLCWGSTYLAIRVVVQSFPPLLMAGCRHLLAGLVMIAFLLARKQGFPGMRQWGAGALVGTLLLLGGNGGVVLAEQWVSSGLASLLVATVPLWMLLFSRLAGHRSSGREWAGMAIGLAGVALLTREGDFAAGPSGAAGFLLLLAGALSWAFGSIWSARLPVAPGFMGAATQMLGGGAAMLAAGFVAGESWPSRFPLPAVAGWLYLVVFGSLVGFTAYLYLLARVRPSLTSSYAYVNPLIAVLLGMAVLGERLSPTGVAAMAVILAGVALTLVPSPPSPRGRGRGGRGGTKEDCLP
jgi:drug/metabolite transporter (DMT)-like permease